MWKSCLSFSSVQTLASLCPQAPWAWRVVPGRPGENLTDTLPVIGSQLTAGTWKWFPPQKKGKTSNQTINSWVQRVSFRGCKSSCKDVLFTSTNPQKTVQNHDSRIFSRRKTMNTRLKKVGKTGLMIFFDENVSRELFKRWFSDGFDKLVAKKHVFI